MLSIIKKGVWVILIVIISTLAIRAYVIYDQKRTLSLFGREIFGNKEKSAIELCKKTEVRFESEEVWEYLEQSVTGITPNSTWLDISNIWAQQNPNAKYSWSSRKTNEKDIYLVIFSDEDGWGSNWEVNLDRRIVRHVNTNRYLSRKYEFSRLDLGFNFDVAVKSGIIDTLKLVRKKNYPQDETMDVVFTMEGRVTNYTGKTLNRADIIGEIEVVFKDKTITGWGSGFDKKISKSDPWEPEETLDFHIETKGIEDIYLQYDPEYVFFTVNIMAEDPIGFKYNKAIREFDLKYQWDNLQKWR